LPVDLIVVVKDEKLFFAFLCRSSILSIEDTCPGKTIKFISSPSNV
jgi:hypothetical protein